MRSSYYAKILRKTKSYEEAVREILLYGCKTWPLVLDDSERLEVFDNDCQIDRCNQCDRVPRAILHQRLQLRTSPALLLQCSLYWFGQAIRRSLGEFIRELIRPDVPVTWCKRTGGQLKTLMTTLKEDPERIIGPAVIGIIRLNKEWTTLAIDLV